MYGTFLPTTQEIQEVFASEITNQGGTVTDAYDDGTRLFLRSTFPKLLEVRPKDKVQGGVALRTTARQIHVHPYTYRQVCSNGAIMARTLQSRRIERVEFGPEEVLAELREAVRVSSAQEAFLSATAEMRSATDQSVDLVLQLLPLLSRLPAEHRSFVLDRILGEFGDQRDWSAFGLMNAVTSVARDTRDPELRWDLEELGGAILSELRPVPSPFEAAAELVTAASLSRR